MTTQYEIQVNAARDTVWIHSSNGETVGRFGRLGVDIHNSIDDQLAGKPQCLFCTHNKTTSKDWNDFIAKALELWNLTLDVNLIQFESS